MAAIDEGLRRVDVSRPRRPDADLVRAEFHADGALARTALMLARYRLRHNCGTSGLPAAEKAEVLRSLDTAMAQLKEAWMARNREGGLSDSLDRLSRLRERLTR
ncbi:MAG TPA: hypothetical protein PKX28_08920, partial [Candidatus Hydrogenedentes bacterium]|nr:hypothetical protein [Candidatus Hydrogenedentota bacterium]